MLKYSVTRIEFDDEFPMGVLDSKSEACDFANRQLFSYWCMHDGKEEYGDEYHQAIENDRKPYAWCFINKVVTGYLVKEC